MPPSQDSSLLDTSAETLPAAVDVVNSQKPYQADSSSADADDESGDDTDTALCIDESAGSLDDTTTTTVLNLNSIVEKLKLRTKSGERGSQKEAESKEKIPALPPKRNLMLLGMVAGLASLMLRLPTSLGWGSLEYRKYFNINI